MIFTHPATGLLVVAISADATNLVVRDTGWLIGYKTLEKLPDGKWEVLGTCTKDAVDFDCGNILSYHSNEIFERTYFDYVTKKFSISKRLKREVAQHRSMVTLLASLGVYFENPCGADEDKYIINNMELVHNMDDAPDENSIELSAKWQSYQSSLVEKVVVLKQVK